ncbi:MAG: hypothetical protein ABI693_24325 [Bryobacteraceae bacterium]
MGHKKQGQLSTRDVVKAIITAPVAHSVPSDANLSSNGDDQLDDKAHFKADIKVVKGLASLNLTEEALLEIIAKGDSTVTPERVRACNGVRKEVWQEEGNVL